AEVAQSYPTICSSHGSTCADRGSTSYSPRTLDRVGLASHEGGRSDGLPRDSEPRGSRTRPAHVVRSCCRSAALVLRPDRIYQSPRSARNRHPEWGGGARPSRRGTGGGALLSQIR